eukprot:scaffold188744_cov30-Tisochrysis_lutea.AAC.3
MSVAKNPGTPRCNSFLGGLAHAAIGHASDVGCELHGLLLPLLGRWESRHPSLKFVGATRPQGVARVMVGIGSLSPAAEHSHENITLFTPVLHPLKSDCGDSA